jgi:hypothetical protein
MSRIANHLLPRDPKQRKALLQLQQAEVIQSDTTGRSTRNTAGGGGNGNAPVVGNPLDVAGVNQGVDAFVPQPVNPDAAQVAGNRFRRER